MASIDARQSRKKNTISAMRFAFYLIYFGCTVIALLACLDVPGCKRPKVVPGLELVGLAIIQLLPAHRSLMS